jgi:hypothetical protein
MRWLPPVPAEGRVPIALLASVLPLEQDRPVTVAGLLAHAAWRSSPERELPLTTAARVAEGRTIGAEEARELRNMWWSAELNSWRSEDATP